MNDEAREILVAAALRGHTQARQLHRMGEIADCAIGLLHIAKHGSRAEASACWHDMHSGACINATQAHYGITVAEGTENRARNDRGEDFLTIARKVGHDEEATP